MKTSKLTIYQTKNNHMNYLSANLCNDDGEIEWDLIGAVEVNDEGTEVKQCGIVRPIQTNKAVGGYRSVSLAFYDSATHTKKKWRLVYLHNLVARLYPQIRRHAKSRLQIHHIDGNPENNNWRNLIPVTVTEHRRIRHKMPGEYRLLPKKAFLKCVSAEDPSDVRYFRSMTAVAKALGCSHVLVHYALDPEHYEKTAKGHYVEYVDRIGD